MQYLFCNALVHVIYSVVSGQYSYAIYVFDSGAEGVCLMTRYCI